MMRDRQRMKLGILLYPTGYHVAAWRLPGTPADAGTNVAHFVDLARQAEAAKLDFLFLADSLATHDGAIAALSHTATRYVNQFEPLTLLSALSMATDRIGLVATASTTYHHPFHIARMFTSIDHLSGGRVGWNAVTGSNYAEARNFGVEPHPARAERYARAREATDVVLGLWDSWSADAFIRDKVSGRFFDPARRRTLDHRGRYFQVAGPLHIARSPQGRPVLFQAGSSGDGVAFAAEYADVIFTAQQTAEDALAFANQIRFAVRTAGRRDSTIPPILPGVMPFLGRTNAEAQAKLDTLNDLVEPIVGISLLEGLLPGVELADLPVDAELPPIVASEKSWSRQSLLERMARREALSIRELYLRVAAGRGHAVMVGTARNIADTLEHWFRIDAADGFNLVPHSLPNALNDMATLLIPELQRRGLARTDYTGYTLRDHLDLHPPM